MPPRSSSGRHKRPRSRRKNSAVNKAGRNKQASGSIPFTKMHGLGNDFVVLDLISHNITVEPALVKAMADRHFGVGCDQLLVVDTPSTPDADFSYRIFNADGNEVEHCGNGARCFAKYVTDKRLTNKAVIQVDTGAGRIVLRMEKDQLITVDMGVPNFEPASLPLNVDQQEDRYRTQINGQNINFWAASMGNPHAIIMVDDIKTAEVDTIGPALQNSELFPNSVNVGFLEIDNECFVNLRVYERGVGETLACGSGACAAVAAGIHNGYLSSPVTVNLSGGSLLIRWDSEQDSVQMSGPASFVFNGHFNYRPAQGKN